LINDFLEDTFLDDNFVDLPTDFNDFANQLSLQTQSLSIVFD
jgi:hypothetical protein